MSKTKRNETPNTIEGLKKEIQKIRKQQENMCDLLELRHRELMVMLLTLLEQEGLGLLRNFKKTDNYPLFNYALFISDKQLGDYTEADKELCEHHA